jgi:F-type H+-transporting ATPase subunit a
MFLLSVEQTAAAEHGAEAAEHAPAAGHHIPPIVEAVNNWIGPTVHQFQIKYTKPFWDNFFANFDTNAEAVFGAYTPENAIPWYTVMFIIASLITLAVVALFARKLSEDNPKDSQQLLEVGIVSVRDLLTDIVGPHGMKYFPIIGTFAVLILVSNLMGLFPGLMSPTASTSVTFALAITSFCYYNYIGIKENGLIGHLKHFAGPVVWIAWLMFPIEIISNLVRPVSLGMRLFGNIFGDEQVAGAFTGLGIYWIVPALLITLSLFASFMQTFIFILLSMVYLGEVSHPPHEEHGHHGEHHGGGDHAMAHDHAEAAATV